jgi:hypothetical protein
MTYHHQRCMVDRAWDVEGVRCSCPSGWPRKTTIAEDKEFQRLAERNNWVEPPED